MKMIESVKNLKKENMNFNKKLQVYLSYLSITNKEIPESIFRKFKRFIVTSDNIMKGILTSRRRENNSKNLYTM